MSNYLHDVRLRVYKNGNLISANDDWQSGANPPEVQQMASYVGAFPLAPTDAALVLVLAPGSYTAEVDSQDGSSGVTLAEIYDVDNRDGTGVGFANISGNSLVTATEPGILSVIVAGNGTQGLLLRAVGPGLAKFGVSGYAPDPELKWVNASTGHLFYGNDDWASNSLNKIRDRRP